MKSIRAIGQEVWIELTLDAGGRKVAQINLERRQGLFFGILELNEDAKQVGCRYLKYLAIFDYISQQQQKALV